MRRACITGGAGFIGSNLADRLRADGVEVAIVDDFRTGRREFVAHLTDDPGVTLHEGDVLDEGLLRRAFDGCDWVFHLQANADVRYGLERPRRDLEQNTIATAGVLEAMRAVGVSRIAFSSTGSIYGEHGLVLAERDTGQAGANERHGHRPEQPVPANRVPQSLESVTELGGR